MKKLRIVYKIATIITFILMLSFNALADEGPAITDSEKYGPDRANRETVKIELPEGTVFHDTPVGNTVINQALADQIKQIVVVGQGSNPADIASTFNVAGPGANIGTLPTPTNAAVVQSTITATTGLTTGINYSTITTKNIIAEKPKNINAPTFALINASTNQIYDTKNATEKYDPSGLTNLMTAYIASQYLKMDQVLNVNATAVGGLDKDASIVALRAGDKITVKDALVSMMVKGAVDAANVIAESVAGSKASFVALMNTTAASLGLQNTKFVDPAGINEGNESTALEMAVIMAKVCEVPELAEYLGITQYTLPATQKREKLIIYNRNTQLTKEAATYNADVVASRLAHTSKAKFCIASMMNQNNNKIIAVVLKAEGTQFSDTKKLFEFAKVAVAE